MTTEQAPQRLGTAGTVRPIRQWHSAKCISTNLDLVLQNVADNDWAVEQVIYHGGRDYTVLYSKAVTR